MVVLDEMGRGQNHNESSSSTLRIAQRPDKETGVVEKYDDKNRLHCEDGPAVVRPREYFDNGICLPIKEYWQKGQLHRVDGPALVDSHSEGTKHEQGRFFVQGQEVDSFRGRPVLKLHRQAGAIHRDDGPAVEFADGGQLYMQNGMEHRDDGPALIRSDGRLAYYKRGRLHREGGPAVIGISEQQYWQNDQLHRDDGPAVIMKNGEELYYLHGQLYPSKSEWESAKSFL